MRTIGITGGVGSGKTAVLDHFRDKYNARIIVADEVAHLLEEPGKPCYNKLVREFGNSILASDEPGAEIDKNKMAMVIFAKPEALEKVNDIIHPEVKHYILAEIDKERQTTREYVIVEAALLIECGYLDLLDEIWYIFTSEEIRRERLKCTRNYSDEKIDRILASQLSEAEYRKYCHQVLDNNSSIEDVKEQVDRLLGEGK